MALCTFFTILSLLSICMHGKLPTYFWRHDPDGVEVYFTLCLRRRRRRRRRESMYNFVSWVPVHLMAANLDNGTCRRTRVKSLCLNHPMFPGAGGCLLVCNYQSIYCTYDTYLAVYSTNLSIDLSTYIDTYNVCMHLSTCVHTQLGRYSRYNIITNHQYWKAQSVSQVSCNPAFFSYPSKPTP